MTKTMTLTINDYTPRPKARPRIGKGRHVYSPSGTDEDNLALLIRSEVSHNYADFVTITTPIRVDIYIHAPKAMKLRGDIDNYAKFVFDALQKAGVIRNDKQIKSTSQSFIINEATKLRS